MDVTVQVCYIVVTLLLHCCYTVVTLLLECGYTVVTVVTLQVMYGEDSIEERLLAHRRFDGTFLPPGPQVGAFVCILFVSPPARR
jgi:hypothetical protein